MISPRRTVVKLVLRDKEFEVKGGMTLLAALEKVQILPESVIATRAGEMILEDEILRDGDVIKLIAVISGGADSKAPMDPAEHRGAGSPGVATDVLTRRRRRLGAEEPR